MRQEFHTSKATTTLLRASCTLVLFLGSAIARADTFTILDALDFGGSAAVVSMNPGRITITEDDAAGLSWTLLPPSPTAVFVTDDCPLGQIGCAHVNIGEYPINPDPAFDFESDIFAAFLRNGVYNVNLIFQTTFPCAAESGCLVRENGLLYTLDIVSWSDATFDTINFQSTTPEPSALVLIGPVLLGVGCFRFKFRKNCRHLLLRIRNCSGEV